jgi:glycosyltransferase involved in cell wall biosynthesis
MRTEPWQHSPLAAPRTPEVTIVVVPREQFGVSGRALETLYERTHQAFSLVYVDGGSPRATRRHLESAALSRGFKLIRTEHYLTPNRARNLGLAHVTGGKYVVFLDNDVLVGPGWLEALIQCAEETGAAAVGPVTCIGEPEGHLVHSAGGLVRVDDRNGIRRLVNENHFEHTRLDEIRPLLKRSETELVEFHCLLVRTDVLARIAPLDEAILNDPHHLDFCLTVRDGGGRVFLEPASVVTQIAPPPVPWSDLPFFLQRWSHPATRRSLQRFTRKWRIPPDDPAIRSLAEWLVHRRHLALRDQHRAIQGVVGWRLGRMIERMGMISLAAAGSVCFYALRHGDHDDGRSA